MIARLALALLLQASADPTRDATVSARVTPEAPAVGEPILVELRVRAPAGTDVRFPVLPDTGSRIEPLDPRVLRDASTDGRIDRSAVYRMIAWDTGSVVVALDDVVLTRDGRERRYPVVLPDIRIRSVLPADTALRVPREASPAVAVPSWHWRFWLGLLVVAALLWWGVRRWRVQRAESAAHAAADAARRAEEAFAHAESLHLLAAGEPGRHLLAHTQVLRRYLAARWPVAGAQLTATELRSALTGTEFPLLPERLVGLLDRAEAVAYAQAPIAADEAERLGLEARAIVDDLETVWRTRRQVVEAPPRRIRRKALR
ncbi:MAG: hypothetical protein KF709_13975 [Gemmatimonadaceae bacterium]|nr:hypothetical protein [Gemmatimonadaceae bacterium]